jgi:hypothetical protein
VRSRGRQEAAPQPPVVDGALHLAVRLYRMARKRYTKRRRSNYMRTCGRKWRRYGRGTWRGFVRRGCKNVSRRRSNSARSSVWIDSSASASARASMPRMHVAPPAAPPPAGGAGGGAGRGRSAGARGSAGAGARAGGVVDAVFTVLRAAAGVLHPVVPTVPLVTPAPAVRPALPAGQRALPAGRPMPVPAWKPALPAPALRYAPRRGFPSGSGLRTAAYIEAQEVGGRVPRGTVAPGNRAWFRSYYEALLQKRMGYRTLQRDSRGRFTRA